MRGEGSKPRSSKKLILDDVCGEQNDSFKNRRGFQNHSRTHGEELSQCTECPEWSGGPENMFNTKKQLVTHMFEYHSTNNVGCSQCNKSFSHVSNLMKHEESHGTIMECQHCMKLYTNRYSFRVKVFLRPWCTQMLTTFSHLNTHIE